MSATYVRSYGAPPWNKKEILRYAGVRDEAPELNELLGECLLEIADKLSYRACYRELPVVRCGEELWIGTVKTRSEALKRSLSGCESAVVFAATVGMEIDRQIARALTSSPAKALLLGAIGSERVEALCDAFEAETAAQKAEEGKGTRPRFSPGYGDLPLGVQREIFAMLDCPRKIGVSLTESFLMSPSKSVTAIIGVTDK